MNARNLPVVLALMWVGGPTPALAVKPGGTLYIKARNTHLKASAEPTASTLAVLQPGMEVTYEGRQGTTPWCQVTAAMEKKGPLRGVIFQSSLAVAPPSMEVSRKNPSKPLSPEAFASSGAAIKAVGPGTLAYGKTLSQSQSAEQLKALVAFTSRITDSQVAAYVQARGQPEGEVRPAKAVKPGRKGKK